MTFYQQLMTKTVLWPGVLDVSLLPKTTVASRPRRTAAKVGNWRMVMKLLNGEKVLVPHQWRPGGKAWLAGPSPGRLAWGTPGGR